MPEPATLERPAAANPNAAETPDRKDVLAAYQAEALADIQALGDDEPAAKKPPRARGTEAKRTVQREAPPVDEEEEEEAAAGAIDLEGDEEEEEVDEYEASARAREAAAEVRGREAQAREQAEEQETAQQRQTRVAAENRVRAAYADRIASFDLEESAQNLVGLTLSDAKLYLAQVKGMFNAHHQDITGHASAWATPEIATSMLNDIYQAVGPKAGLPKKVAAELVAKRGEIKDSPTFIKELVTAARQGYVPQTEVDVLVEGARVKRRQELESTGEVAGRGRGGSGRNGGAATAKLGYRELQNLYGSGEATPAQEAEFARQKAARDQQRR